MHTHRHHQRSQSDRGGWQDHARGSSGAGVGAPSPGRFGPRHRRRADPAAGGRQVQRDPRAQRASRTVGPGRGGGDRRCDAHPGGHSPVDHPARWSYLLTPLGNQKTLHRTLKALPWKNVPSFSSVDTGHGRRVRRTVKAVKAPAWVDFSAAAQVLQPSNYPPKPPPKPTLPPP